MNEANQSSDSACKPPTSTKNKVWVVEYHDSYEGWLLGVYTSEERAKRAKESQPTQMQEYLEIDEVELDLGV